MEKRTHAGYEIINAMQIKNTFGNEVEIVLGFNEKAASPFVTWETRGGLENCVFGHYFGHYFSSKEAAIKDFFERGMKESGLDLREEYRNEAAIEAISEALSYHFKDLAVESLLNNESFSMAAMDKYFHIDHSDENEVLRGLLEDLYSEKVNNHEIFDFEAIEILNDSDSVTVCMVSGEKLEGKAFFNTRSSLDSFFLELSGENVSDKYRQIEIADVVSIENEVAPIYKNDMAGTDKREKECASIEEQILGALEETKEKKEKNLDLSIDEVVARSVKDEGFSL